MSEENLLMSILLELKKANNHSRLWTIDDLEHYFQMGRTTVTKKIINQPDFPKSISIQNTLPRWHREEVEAWAKRQRS